MIVHRLLSALKSRAHGLTVSDVRIGLGYTAVQIDNGNAGLAYTFRDHAQPGCNAFDTARPLATRSAADLLYLLESADVIATGVGLACANAFANQQATDALSGDILEHLDLRADDHVGMVGLFRPLVGPLEERAGSLTVFERSPAASHTTRPAHEALKVLPDCQVALITATSIINKSIDELLGAARKCREVVVLGASTPLLPELFADTAVTMLSGVVVTEPAQALQVVSEGGGMRTFRRHCDKVCLRT